MIRIDPFVIGACGLFALGVALGRGRRWLRDRQILDCYATMLNIPRRGWWESSGALRARIHDDLAMKSGPQIEPCWVDREERVRGPRRRGDR